MEETAMSPSLKQWLPPHRAEISPGFFVGRILPFRGGQGVGPFVFLDHMGPHTIPIGQGADVAPHPHIGLSTLTYLFDGEIEHRDSLGSVQRILPGDVNWMTAGSGVVHSERSPAESRDRPRPFHGAQAWVALPVEFEEVSPSFEHVEADRLPVFERDGVRHVLAAGEAFGLRSPVKAFSRLFYAHSEIAAGSRLVFDPEGQEAAFFLVSGEAEVDGETYAGPGLLHFDVGVRVEIIAKSACSGLLLGGDPLVEHRRIWWNFVSTRPERIEEAKRRWKEREFPKVPGETEFIPLPG